MVTKFRFLQVVAWRNDPTTSGEDVNYCYAAAPHENDYDVVSEELVRKIVNSVC